MKEFDYIIIGGGCAGLSLAYELEIHNKLENKTLAIIEPRDEYKRDKTWSFWRVSEHNFDDCVIKNWKNFSVNAPNKTNFLECENYPYQSIDSGLFYEKINNSLKLNKNIFFLKELKDINIKNSFIFNSVPTIKKDFRNLWQHFCGVEIETDKISNVVESQISGILVRQLVAEGSTYKVGSLIGVIIEGDVEEDEIDNFIRKFETEEKIKKK